MTYVEPIPDNAPREVTVLAKDLKKLKERAKEAERLEAELTATRRQAAFSQAGVDPSHPAAKYFMAGYEGEPTADAVRAEWQTIAGNGQQADPTVDQELADLQNAQSLTTGGRDLPPDRLAERDAKLRAATSEKEFDRIFEEYGGVRKTQ